MREVPRWAVRQPRVWASVLAVVVAVATSGNGPPGWAVFVVTTTVVLAGLSIRAKYVTDHPGRAGRAAAKRQEEVDAILWRYERERAARDRAEERR